MAIDIVGFHVQPQPSMGIPFNNHSASLSMQHQVNSLALQLYCLISVGNHLCPQAEDSPKVQKANRSCCQEVQGSIPACYTFAFLCLNRDGTAWTHGRCLIFHGLHAFYASPRQSISVRGSSFKWDPCGSSCCSMKSKMTVLHF